MMLKRIRTGLPILALVAGTLLTASPALAQEEETLKFCVLHNPNNPHFVQVDEEGLIEHFFEHGDVIFSPLCPVRSARNSRKHSLRALDHSRMHVSHALARFGGPFFLP